MTTVVRQTDDGRNHWRRHPADCIGRRGLPADRAGLDALAERVALRIEAAGPAGIRGRRLVAEFALHGTRALRELIAYSRLVRRWGHLLAVPGSGYYSAAHRPDLVAACIADNERRGRDHFAIAAVHRTGRGQLSLFQPHT